MTVPDLELTQLTEDHRALRGGVAELCKDFPARTGATSTGPRVPEGVRRGAHRGPGTWLALIPAGVRRGRARHHRGGLILENITVGANAAACHAQMYTMGTLLRHGRGAEAALPAGDRLRRAAAPGLWGHRAERRLRDDQLETTAVRGATGTSSTAGRS